MLFTGSFHECPFYFLVHCQLYNSGKDTKESSGNRLKERLGERCFKFAWKYIEEKGKEEYTIPKQKQTEKYWVTIQIKLNKIPTGPIDEKLLYSTEWLKLKLQRYLSAVVTHSLQPNLAHGPS